MAADWRHFNTGFMDWSRTGWNPEERTGIDLRDYTMGFDHARSSVPLKHSTRPDPSRAEMAMHLLAADIASGAYLPEDHYRQQAVERALLLTDCLRAALEKPKP